MAGVDGTSAGERYYLSIGVGRWLGSFRFRVTSWRRLRAERIGLKHWLLVAMLHAMQRLTGAGSIDSVIVALDGGEERPIARNAVRIRRFGLALYTLDETYALGPDGRSVTVDAHERFGPIPFLLRNSKRHGAVIGEDGRSSRYDMPLLGAAWVAEYEVSEDGREIRGRLHSSWAEASEAMRKQ
jgi:hypothetical protein